MHKHQQKAVAMQTAATWHVRKLWRAWLSMAVNQGRQRRATASATAHACLLACEQRLQQVCLEVRAAQVCGDTTCKICQ